jgi:RNA polymerase sigma-70 factor, ECF subfamily
MLTDEEIRGLYVTYGHVLYRRCRRILRDEQAAQDALQEVFCAVVRYRQSFLERADISHWLHRVTTHCCLRLLRKGKLRPEAARTEDPGEDELPAPGQLPEELARRQLVLRLLDAFDEKTQAVAVCTFVEGLLQEETARVMGISDRAVRKRLDRFKTRARALLAKWEGGAHVA